MSMTLTAAKQYVARPLGGAGNPDILAMAAEAIQRAYTDWQNDKFWTFLLKDTSATTSVAACNCAAAASTVAAPSTGAFDFVNVGQTVTIAAAETATLAAGTTVSSITRGSDGVVTLITLSNAFGGTTDTSSTLTFSANIPILTGVDSYNVPNDFSGAYDARLTDGEKSPVRYIDLRSWDRVTNDQTLQGLVECYTTYNPVSEGTQNFGAIRLKVFKVPNANRTMLLRYFRKFNVTATSIDVPDNYLYQFLDYARGLLLKNKIAMENPQGMIADAERGYQTAKNCDEQPNDDDDGDSRLKSPYESINDRPIVGNGEFSPYPF